jgi:hypothetical protein
VKSKDFESLNSPIVLAIMEWEEYKGDNKKVVPDQLSLDSAPNLGPLISRWEINKFDNC